MADTWDPKDPADVLDYAHDWAAVLAQGETISTSDGVIITDPTTPALAIDSQEISGTKSVLWLSGGLAGTKYEISITIETDQLRTFNRKVFLKVKDL